MFVDYYVDSYASLRITYKSIGKLSTVSNYSKGTDISLSERREKWGKLLYMKPAQYILLGSSRSMQISQSTLKKNSFYNLSVSGGCTIEDYLSEVYILESLNKIPNYLLLEVSPSMFNNYTRHHQYQDWGNSYEYMKDMITGGELIKKDESSLLGIQYKDLIAPSYFQYNFQQLLEGNRTYIIATDLYDNDLLPTQHVDGSYAYSREYQKMYDTDAIYESIEETCKNRNVFFCKNFESLDYEVVNEFELLISYLENKGINISFYLPPYSEYMYDYICNDDYYHSILEVEDYILAFSRDNSIQVYGSYNPTNSHLQLSDQYDAYHIKPEKIKDTMWVRFDDLENVWNK